MQDRIGGQEQLTPNLRAVLRANPATVLMNSPKFIPQIEALRGLAAMCVVVEHAFVTMTPSRVGMFSNSPKFQETLQWIIHTVFNGRAAVLLFFALSGYVLKLQWDGQHSYGLRKYTSFAIRRIFRIVPALWVSVLFAYVCAVITPLDVDRSVENLIKTFFLQSISLNVSLWTIITELYCSLMFPILLWVHKKLIPSGHIVVLLLLIGNSMTNHDFRFCYLLFFYVGLLVHDYGEYLVQRLGSWEAPTLIFSLAAYCLFPQIWVFENSIFTIRDNVYYQIGELIPCFIIVSVVVFGRNRVVDWVLLSRPARYLGKISYSLYLFHYVISGVVWTSLLFRVPTFLPLYYLVDFSFFICIAALSILVATIVYFAIERPFNKIGRKVGSFIELGRAGTHRVPVAP